MRAMIIVMFKCLMIKIKYLNTNGHKSLRLPFIIYSDLECLLEKKNIDKKNRQ